MPWGSMTWVIIVPELGYGVPNVTAGNFNLGSAVYPTLVGGNAFTMRKTPLRQVIRSADGGNRRKFVVGSRRQYQGTLNTLFHPDQGPFWATSCQTIGLGMATGQATISGGAVTGVTLTSPGFGYPISSTTIPVSFFDGAGTGAYGAATSDASGHITAAAVTAGGTGYTSPPGVQIGGMPSYSILFWDGVQYQEFLGCCIQNMNFTASAAQDYISIAMNWIGQQRPAVQSSIPSWPAANKYSALNPYLFVESAGNVTLTTDNVTSPVVMPLTKYRQFSFTLNNVLQGTWDESTYITSLLYCGRDMDFAMTPQYLGQAWPATSPTSALYQTFRKDFEDQSAISMILSFIRTSPSHSFTINAQTNSYISNIADDIPLDNASYQACTVQAFIDSTTPLGSDFTITAN